MRLLSPTRVVEGNGCIRTWVYMQFLHRGGTTTDAKPSMGESRVTMIFRPHKKHDLILAATVVYSILLFCISSE